MFPRIAIASKGDIDDYVKSVEAAGGEAVIVDPAADVATRVLDEVQGVLLTGGKDVDPMRYGEVADPTVQFAGDARDGLEIDMVMRALERDVPVLAICRGLQVLNVALGGTLVQDIPSSIPRTLDHRVRDPRDAIAHEVRVAPGSLLARTLWPEGGESLVCAVNSRHHQAVKRLASSLVITANAPDGIVEAVERPASAFCLGVQWHPENFWRTGEFDSLFEALIGAAEARTR